MALFKVNRGKSENLPQERHNGWAYFCTDTAEFFIDYEDDAGIIQRKQLNAAEASRLIGYDIVNEINESSEVEIPTTKAILGHLGKYVSLPDRGAIIQLSEALLAALPELADGQQHTIEFTPDEEDTSELLEFQIQSAIQQHNTAVETHTDIRADIVSAKETANTYADELVAAIDLTPYSTATNLINGTAEGSLKSIFADEANAGGIYSFAEGYKTIASGEGSHAEGPYVEGIGASQATGFGAHAEGVATIASGSSSHAEGGCHLEYVDENGNIIHTTAAGFCSHAEGVSTQALGDWGAHAEGSGTIASGDSSHAEGGSDATGNWSHAEGNGSVASGYAAHAEGYGTIASGDESHAEGQNTLAYGLGSHSEGQVTYAYGQYSHAQGCQTYASGNYSHAEGQGTVALGNWSHAEGYRPYGFTMPYGMQLTGEKNTITYTVSSINNVSLDTVFIDKDGTGAAAKVIAIDVENNTVTLERTINPHKDFDNEYIVYVDRGYSYGPYSHTEGYQTTALGQDAHAEGSNTYASGDSSHAEGSGTRAEGNYSHASGREAKALGNCSYAHGEGVVANHDREYVIGSYNLDDGNAYRIVVGNGAWDGQIYPSNAHTLDPSGNAWFSGDVYVGSTSGKNKDEGSKKLATEEYVNTVKNDLLNGAGEAYDTLKELGDLIDDNHDAIDALEIVAASKVAQTDFNSHINNKNNPHGVTAAQVGAPTVAEMNAAISAIPTPDVSGQINTHNTSTTAHSDIRTSITDIVNGTTTIGKATSATNATNATNIYSSASTAKAYVLGTTTASSANHATVYNASVYTSGSVLYGAAWNDYAEYRISDCYEAGRVICENGDDTLSIATKRLQPGASVISDTFGFAIGETEEAKTPIAVSGRVLVYTYEDRNEFKAGDAVCAAPNGTVSKMTREEIREYPERIVGVVSAIPNYNTWGAGNVPVNNRIWIKVK